ncbi:MAG: hypothetical protein M0D57_13795 [Sphingobacteriales bacterium JAD_PAG50586_3]|nr:MAG: hypothetical protein M0D57_13795 [Sphingobacteriales bacterium JAD_PAG50586_3]
MRTRTFLLMGLLCLLVMPMFSQTPAFEAGYYIINSNAQYSVIMPSGADYHDTGDGCFKQYTGLKMAAGEVVIAFEFSKGKFYCFDPNGRMVVFQGQNCLTKAPIVTGCGVGRMDEEIELITGDKLNRGAYYWIVGQNIGNSTIKIQVADGAIYDIPKSNMSLFTVYIKDMAKDQDYKIAE